MEIGTPKYEQSTKNYFSFKKDQNMFILRILPPLGNLAKLGKWHIYHRVEFGYSGTDGKMRPFLSPRVVNYNKMVEVESEAHLRREKLKAQQKAAKEAGNIQLEETVTKMLEKYNQDAKHYMNAVDLNGNVGLFKIGQRGFEALKNEISRLRSEGVDPIGIDNGRFFVFARSGRGRDTLYTVKEYKQKVEIEQNGERFTVDKPFPHKLTGDIIAKLETDAFELDSIYPSVTPEEEYRIVHEGAKAVDEILGNKKTDKKEMTTATSGETNSETVPEQSTPRADATSSAPTPEQEAQHKAIMGGGVSAESVALAEEQTTPAVDVSNMSEEDFFKMIENGDI